MSRATGRQLDGLAELEEERRFLLRSLRDLEREREAGDVDDADFETLRDGYTARAAAVLRQIETGRRRSAPAPPRRWTRRVVIAVVVAVLATGIGVALGQAWGERGRGDEITGSTPAQEVIEILTTARAAMGRGDFGTANALFFEAVQREEERGVENPEPLAYYGWTLALGTRNNPDAAESDRQLELALLALGRAIEMDPTYADPHCFVAIVESEFRSDPSRALPFVETCESLDPPAEVADVVAAFADEIRAAAG